MVILYDLIFGVFVLTAIAAIFGNYLDKKFNTSPLLSVLLGIIAIIVGLTRLVLKAREATKQGGKEARTINEKDNS